MTNTSTSDGYTQQLKAETQKAKQRISKKTRVLRHTSYFKNFKFKFKRTQKKPRNTKEFNLPKPNCLKLAKKLMSLPKPEVSKSWRHLNNL